jgi:DNA-binding CsgD family transcriptional regulator
MVATEIIGREEELAELRRFLDGIDRVPVAFLMEGEPGVGKTALWRAGVELARERGLRVLTAIPATAETRLSFAALADLLAPVLADVLRDLPPPQRRALEIALLLEDAEGPPPDRRAVAFAFLGALRALARDGPVVVAVDDVQWLDGPSAFIVEFALRRLRDEPVVFLLTLRTGEGSAPLGLERALPQEGLWRLTIGPLSLGALHRLLRDQLGQVFSRPNLRRLHQLSGGNPFFALELARALERGSIRLEAGEPLPAMLGTLVQERLAVLPDETRAALLAASALSKPTLALVADAVGGDSEGRLAPALEANVIELEGERIRFSHPLLSSGIYAEAGSAERRALHRRLAEVVPDPEESVRHLALGAPGPAGDIAAALGREAQRAHRRGAFAAAAELSELARRLTPAEMEESRHRRTIQAAVHAWEAGEAERARELLSEALVAAQSGPRRGEVLYWLGSIQEYEGDRRQAVHLYREARLNSGEDAVLLARAEEGLASALFLLRSDLSAAAGHARSAVALAEQAGNPGMEIAALSQVVLIDAVTGGNEWRAAAARGRELEERTDPVQTAVSATFAFAVVLTWVDEFGPALELFRSMLEQAEERGEESAVPWILAQLCWAEFLAGSWEEADRHAEEGIDLALRADQEPQRVFALGVRALIRAGRGDVQGARADAEATLEGAEERGVMMATIVAAGALGLLELSLERFDAVDRLLGPLGARLEAGGVREPGSVRFAPDEIEALIGLGRLEEAKALLDVLERRARQLDRASALAAGGRCHGLLAAGRGDLDGALASLEKALGQHERVSMPFEQARTLLALGATRRRARMKRPAREALEQALAIFDALGARLWAEKARAELARIGGRRAAATGELTPTERRIAVLAAEGRSNKEIATALFVTPKTVGTQLSRIYRKVGVRSRTELARHMSGDAETPKV